MLHWGGDGMFVACGTLLGACVQAADGLADEGLDFGVINARFVKPLDAATILRAVRECPLVVTVEEGVLMGGFGSAVLEAASDAGLDTSRVRRLGIPDQFIEHGSRSELLADLGLDAAGIVRACRQWIEPPTKAATRSAGRDSARQIVPSETRCCTVMLQPTECDVMIGVHADANLRGAPQLP